MDKFLGDYLLTHSQENLFDDLFKYLAKNTQFFQNTKQGKTTILNSFKIGNQIFKQKLEEDEWEILLPEPTKKQEHEFEEFEVHQSPIETKIQEERTEVIPNNQQKIYPVLKKQSRYDKFLEDQKQQYTLQLYNNEKSIIPYTYQQHLESLLEKSKNPEQKICLPLIEQPQEPINNGGNTELYTWSQNLNEVQITLNQHFTSNSNDFRVQITSDQIQIYSNFSRKHLLQKTLYRPIEDDESYWLLEKLGTQKYQLSIYLQKQQKMQWWKKVFWGDSEIDITKIIPSYNDKLLEINEGKLEMQEYYLRQRSFSESILLNTLAKQNMYESSCKISTYI